MKENRAHLHIAMSEKLKKELELEAQKKGMNLSVYVRMILNERSKK